MEKQARQKYEGTRPNLFYHATPFASALELMPKYGLLSDSHTITRSMTIATRYADGHKLPTFWYPGKQEIDKNIVATQPRLPLSSITKERIREGISGLDIDFKDYALRLVKRANAYLPAEGLGAIAILTQDAIISLNKLFPSLERSVVRRYASEKNEFTADVKKVLDTIEITFLDPHLNRKELAKDMVETALENYLLHIGFNLRIYRREKAHPDQRLIDDLVMLEEVTFGEPVYERYRKILVAEIKHLIDNASSAKE